MKNIPKFRGSSKFITLSENITPFEEQLLPNNWIKPMVNVNQTSKFAKDRIFSLRKMTNHKMLAKSVYIKHGSRKCGKIKYLNPYSELKIKYFLKSMII